MKKLVILISGRGSNMEAIIRAQIPGAKIAAVISNRPDAAGLAFAASHGITALPGVLVARYLGDNSEAARLWFARLWQTLRPACCGRPAVPPRIWNT